MEWAAAGLATLSSCLHLSWNTLMRSRAGSLRFAWYLVLSGGLFAALVTWLFRVPVHVGPMWPWLLATIAVHTLYFAALAQSYRNGALQEIYPAARGGGILFSMLLAFGLFGAVPSPAAALGAVVIALAVILPALTQRAPWTHLRWVLAVAVLIAGYSAIDSHSVQVIAPWPYISAQSLGTAVLLAPWALRTARIESTVVWQAIGSGVASIVSYVLILYAYRVAAVGPVLAFRQIAVALAPWVGWLVLTERRQARTLISAVAIFAGCALIIWA